MVDRTEIKEGDKVRSYLAPEGEVMEVTEIAPDALLKDGTLVATCKWIKRDGKPDWLRIDPRKLIKVTDSKQP